MGTDERQATTPAENTEQHHAVKDAHNADTVSPKGSLARKLFNWFMLLLAISGVGLISIFVFLSDSFQANRKYRVLVPLFASSQEYLDFMSRADGHYPIKDFRRKVSVDTIYALEAAKSAWFRANPNNNLNSAKFDFYYFPEGYDETSYKAAFERALMIADKEDFEVVGVIGHVTSTVTQAYGKFYGQHKLPVILPLSTATNLTDYLRGTCNVPAVLRLPPNNAKQAELISKFLLNQKAYRVLIAKDLSNLVYSDDLVEGFRYHFVTEPLENHRKSNEDRDKPAYLVDHGQILAVIPGGGPSGAPITYFEIKELNASALLLMGMTDFSLETIAQARASDISAKYTILTDGTIDQDLLPRLNRLISDKLQEPTTNTSGIRINAKQQAKLPDGGTIYITFPLSKPMPEKIYDNVFKEFHQLDNELGGPRDLEMTHTQYAVDAAQIMLTALKISVVDAGYSWLEDANEAVAIRIEQWNKKKMIEDKFSTYDEDKTYTLDGSGNTLKLEYHLYHATLPGVTPEDFKAYQDSNGKAQQKEQWAKVKWIHDAACPIELQEKPKQQ